MAEVRNPPGNRRTWWKPPPRPTLWTVKPPTVSGRTLPAWERERGKYGTSVIPFRPVRKVWEARRGGPDEGTPSGGMRAPWAKKSEVLGSPGDAEVSAPAEAEALF